MADCVRCSCRAVSVKLPVMPSTQSARSCRASRGSEVGSVGFILSMNGMKSRPRAAPGRGYGFHPSQTAIREAPAYSFPCPPPTNSSASIKPISGIPLRRCRNGALQSTSRSSLSAEREPWCVITTVAITLTATRRFGPASTVTGIRISLRRSRRSWTVSRTCRR